jgi:hypothetical protein
MAGFQLAGPAADVRKILYGKNRSLYEEPKRTVRYLEKLIFITDCVELPDASF